MKRAAGILCLAALASCSQSDRGSEAQYESSDLKTYDTAEQRAPAAPGIVPTAAPGVAFTYHYGFRMPDAAISAAQEVHAASCEKLGLERCRITGMTYELDSRDRVRGTLELAIDPLLARSFGRDAIAVVEKEEGKLRYARIEGQDQNPALDEAARRQTSANQSIAQLEADLAKAKTENERVQIREQIRQLRQQIEQAKTDAARSEARIQRTPMTFTYDGGGASGRGFAGDNPAREAWYLFVDSLATMVSLALKALAILLPWALLFALLIAIGRSRLFNPLRRWWREGPEGRRAEADKAE